ncbi:MAG: ATP-binding protein [Planctomycetota bacterium]
MPTPGLRLARERLLAAARQQLVVGVTGPRQAGKTTLVRSCFPDHAYLNLEDPELLAFAQRDPKGFLARDGGMIIDEVQRVPALLSVIQTIVDVDPRPGRFIITGSQVFALSAAISQSLAGRIALITLLPFSLGELAAMGRAPERLDTLLLTGGYPPIYDRDLPPRLWLADYITTYIERDVRQVLEIRDLAAFQRFVTLCAGWVGQLVNLSSLASDAGVTVNTAKSWLGVLQTSGLIHLLQPHHRNFRKRLIKKPKLHWIDSGLCCRLLGIQDADHLATHPARGAIFESWVCSELLKGRYQRGETANLYFWRNHVGDEIDLLADHGQTLLPIECKSGATIAGDWLSGLTKWTTLAGADAEPPVLVHGGTTTGTREGVRLVPWHEVPTLAGTC